MKTQEYADLSFNTSTVTYNLVHINKVQFNVL